MSEKRKMSRQEFADTLANYGLERKTVWSKNKTICKSIKGLSEADKKACFENCQILGNNVYLSMNARFTQRNANTMIYGGSGTGKSRFYVKPNILQMYGSYVITDPSGELLQTCAKPLADNGYKIKVLNINDMTESLRYNPFYYVKNIKDIPSLVQVMISNIEGPRSGGGGDGKFWDLSTQALLAGICGYLFEARPMEERTFSNVGAMLRMIDMQQLSSDPNYVSPLDRLFDDWDEKTKGQSYAVKQYKTFKIAPDKTAGNILISTAVLFGKFFDLPEMANLACKDEMELDKIGEEKTALFLIIPVGDPVYNFLTSVLISQLFRVLYKQGEEKMHRENSDNPSLKEHVTFILDEIANIGTIPNLDLYMSTVRKYNISIVPIFQAKSQMETDAYKQMAGNLIGNCDTLIFLGGSEKSTLDMLTDRMGKRTIRNHNFSTNGKKNGNSRSIQGMGRNVMDNNEIMEMEDDQCIIFVRGQKPFKVAKYPYEKHPKYHLTGDADKSQTMTLKEFDMKDPYDSDLLVFSWETLTHTDGKGNEITQYRLDERGNKRPAIYADDYLESITVIPPCFAKDEQGRFLNENGYIIEKDKDKPKNSIVVNAAGQRLPNESTAKFIGACINGKMIPYSFPDPSSSSFKGQFKLRRTAKDKRESAITETDTEETKENNTSQNSDTNTVYETETTSDTNTVPDADKEIMEEEMQEEHKEKIKNTTTEQDQILSDILTDTPVIGILNQEADFEFGQEEIGMDTLLESLSNFINEDDMELSGENSVEESTETSEESLEIPEKEEKDDFSIENIATDFSSQTDDFSFD